MLYVHSMWTPQINNKPNVKYLLNNYNMFLLSVLLIKKHGHRIELYCDKDSYNIFSKIPYDKINIIDFESDGIDKFFWIWAKIKAQILVNEPYVHIDGDVLMFRDIIGNKIKNGEYPAVVQSTENELSIGDWFDKTYKQTKNPYLKFSKHNIDWDKYGLNAYNCGVVGFHDMKLKDKYLNKVKELLIDLSNDDTFIRDFDVNGGVYMITEQSLLYYILNENNIKPLEIIPYEEILNTPDNWYHKIPRKIGYCHMLGPSKEKEIVKEKIKLKIRNFFPEYSNIIKN